MTIKATDLLLLLTKAEQLDLSATVRKDEDGDYVIRIYEMFRDERFDKTVFITQDGKTNWDKGIYSFDGMVNILDQKLEEQRQEEIKEQKRQELLARLTDEEKELLNLK